MATTRLLITMLLNWARVRGRKWGLPKIYMRRHLLVVFSIALATVEISRPFNKFIFIDKLEARWVLAHNCWSFLKLNTGELSLFPYVDLWWFTIFHISLIFNNFLPMASCNLCCCSFLPEHLMTQLNFSISLKVWIIKWDGCFRSRMPLQDHISYLHHLLHLWYWFDRSSLLPQWLRDDLWCSCCRIYLLTTLKID